MTNPTQPDQEKTSSVDKSPPQRICLKHMGHYESECPTNSPDQALVAAWMESLGFIVKNDMYKHTSLYRLITDQEATFFYQAHVAAVAKEHERWVTASMKRLAKYDLTGIPPETQALIDAAVAEGRREAIGLYNQTAISVQADNPNLDTKAVSSLLWITNGRMDEKLAQLTPPKQEGE